MVQERLETELRGVKAARGIITKNKNLEEPRRLQRFAILPGKESFVSAKKKTEKFYRNEQNK